MLRFKKGDEVWWVEITGQDNPDNLRCWIWGGTVAEVDAITPGYHVVPAGYPRGAPRWVSEGDVWDTKPNAINRARDLVNQIKRRYDKRFNEILADL
jgi:hypothetical protein